MDRKKNKKFFIHLQKSSFHHLNLAPISSKHARGIQEVFKGQQSHSVVMMRCVISSEALPEALSQKTVLPKRDLHALNSAHRDTFSKRAACLTLTDSHKKVHPNQKPAENISIRTENPHGERVLPPETPS